MCLSRLSLPTVLCWLIITPSFRDEKLGCFSFPLSLVLWNYFNFALLASHKFCFVVTCLPECLATVFLPSFIRSLVIFLYFCHFPTTTDATFFLDHPTINRLADATAPAAAAATDSGERAGIWQQFVMLIEKSIQGIHDGLASRFFPSVQCSL